jgi:predicted acylesterase/phospholipase RssA
VRRLPILLSLAGAAAAAVVAAGMAVSGPSAAAAPVTGTAVRTVADTTTTVPVVPISKWTPHAIMAWEFAEKDLYAKLGPTTPVDSTEKGTSNDYQVVIQDAHGTQYLAVVALNAQGGGSLVSVTTL